MQRLWFTHWAATQPAGQPGEPPLEPKEANPSGGGLLAVRASRRPELTEGWMAALG